MAYPNPAHSNFAGLHRLPHDPEQQGAPDHQGQYLKDSPPQTRPLDAPVGHAPVLAL